MRRGLVGFMIVTSLLATAQLVLAEDPPPQQTAPAERTVRPGIAAVTDGAGNPVPVDAFALPPRRALDTARESAAAEIQRGQAWWPYKSALPPYTAVGVRAEAMTEDEILVNGVAVLNVRAPGAALRQMPADLVLETNSQLAGDEGFYLVKIKGFTRNQEQVKALEEAGAVLGEFININTYIAKIPSRAFAAVRALPFVTFVGDYQPAYKISPRIGLESIPWEEAYDATTGQPKPWAFEVVLHKGADLEAVLDRLGKLGISPKRETIVSGEDTTFLYVEADPSAVPALAKIPGVKWIAEKVYPRLTASSTSPATVPMILQNNGAFVTDTSTGWKLWNAGVDGNLSGTAQVVTLMDTGLNTSMEHFSQNTVSVGGPGSLHRKVAGYDNLGGDVCVTAYSAADGGHGTWTSQHAVGSISNMTTNPDTTHTPTTYYDVGVARDAKVYFQDIGTSTGSLSPPGDLTGSVEAAIGKGSFVQNHSWGSATPTYTARASNIDSALTTYPDFVVTVAAGNDGAGGTNTINDFCTAKNVICVGGADAAAATSLYVNCNWDGSATCVGSTDLGSGRGPVSVSGRTKPDVLGYMAFGTTVGGENMAGNRPAAMCQTDATKTVYWDFVNNSGYGGTSFSAPQVAGLAALVRDYFQAGVYPSGTATPADAITPSGSLVKAVILASGEDMLTTASPTTTVAISKRYGNDVGYGRANLPAALHLGSGAPYLWVQNNDRLGDGATRTFYYTINGNGVPLRVMMVYYDAAGNALQKDADLKVTIGANVYWGNNFSNGWSTASTAVRDHTNNTEGVFLNAGSGLPATGTVQVDVIGYSNPGGLDYSLVVVGDVLGTQVSLDSRTYRCSQEVRVTVADASATSPVSVTLTSKDSGGTVIDTEVVSCAGSNGVFRGTIETGTGILVSDGGTLTATYGSATPAISSVACQPGMIDGGFLIEGGCDNDAAGTDTIYGPLYNSGSNEFYNEYMDAGEFITYTVGLVNQSGAPLTDVSVALSFSGAGASKMTVFNSPVHIGPVSLNGLTGAAFQLYVDPSTAGLTAVNLDFDITSPADGYTTAKRLTHTVILQADDIVTRQAQCSTFDTGLAPWYESVFTFAGAVANPWRWIGAATTPATVGSENRTDGACGNATANAGAMVGNSATTTANNFALNADSMLLLNFQPALRGNAPNGQPYHYVWKWHSFYHASEALGNQSGAYAAFYNDKWNSATNPTADQAASFAVNTGYLYHSWFDYVGTWNWETLNTGIPDDPHYGPGTGGAPNQKIIIFSGMSGLATTGTWFAYGHEHADIYWFNGTHPTRRDIALDNDRLVYDEYYTGAQTNLSCGAGGQVGQVAFDRYTYEECPTAQAVVSVMDGNAVSSVQVVVKSPGTGDSETLTLTGTAPYFSAALALATNDGYGADNGVLYVLPGEVLVATYTDGSPAGSTSAYALTECVGGNVVYVSNTQVSDNGDNDGYADNNETITLDIAIRNNMATDLTNTVVKIFPASPDTVDCIFDAQAAYGTVPAGATVTNPPSDRFSFHVAPSVACSNFSLPPLARFVVVITADGIAGPSTVQRFVVNLDLDSTGAGGTYTYTQTFDADPGWTLGATADDDGACDTSYSDSFHWCAACGNGGGGFGAWIGDSAFGTAGQNYGDYDSATLYSPVFVANGNVFLQFSVAYRTEATYDGGLVQYKLGAGSWSALDYASPAQAATTTTTNACSPLGSGVNAWTGDGVGWTATSNSGVVASAGTNIQFRWRLGTDAATLGTGYGGYGVDNVVITGLRQTAVCEPTRNTGLPGCGPACDPPSGLTNNTAADLDPVADTGVQVSWAQDAGDWGDGGTGTRTYDVLRDASPVATGIAYGTTTWTDTTGANGTTYTYSVRYNNGCGESATTAGATASDQVCSVPAEVDNGVQLAKSGTDAVITWNLATGATSSDVLRGLVSALPVGPGGGEELCLAPNTALLTATDTAVPAEGAAFWYLVRGRSACGNGTYGYAATNGVPGTVRTSTTCP